MRTQRCKACKDTYIYDENGPIKECSCRKIAEANRRFYLAQDDDCHWYVVPFAKRHEFEDWVASGEPDGEPEGVERVGGSPTLVTFADYRIE
jgi:hypothetical protein